MLILRYKKKKEKYARKKSTSFFSWVLDISFNIYCYYYLLSLYLRRKTTKESKVQVKTLSHFKNNMHAN